MGITLNDQGKPEEAIDAYQDAIKIKPGYNKAYNNLGSVLKNQGKLEDANHAYRQEIKNSPS